MDTTRAANKSLSIIIPTYKGTALLEEFLPSVIAAVKNYPGNSELILVDDCSPDGSFAAAQKFLTELPCMKLLRTPENGGFSSACNYGARHSSKEILFFLNNDVRLAPDYFAAFSGYFREESVFALSPCGYNYWDNTQLDGIKTCRWRRGFMRFTKNIYNSQLRLPPDEPYLSFSFQGAYFFADAAKFRELGGFDELYSPYIMEETDLAYRALKRGWKIIYGPQFQAWHKAGSSINSKTSAKAAFLSERNRLLFTWKNISDGGLLASNLLFVLLRLLALSPVKWKAFLAALKMLPQIKAARKLAASQAVYSDRQLLKFYGDYFARISSREKK